MGAPPEKLVPSTKSSSDNLMDEDPQETQPLLRASIDAPIPISKAIEMFGFGRYQTKLLLMCGALIIADAMEMILVTFLLPAVKAAWGLHSYQTGLIGAGTFCGMLCGAYTWGTLADLLGRRSICLSSALWTGVWGMLSASMADWWQLAIARAMVGFGVAGAVTSFALISEFMPPSQRRALIFLQGPMWGTGCLIAGGLAWACLEEGGGWRVLVVACSTPMIVLPVVLYWFLPESPQYLALSNQTEALAELVSDVARENGQPAELFANVNFCCDESSERGRIGQLFAPGLQATTLLLWLCWFCTVVLYYGLVMVTPHLFGTSTNKLSTTVFAVVILTTLAEFPGYFVTYSLLGPLGRVRLLVVSGLLSSLFMLLVDLTQSSDVSVPYVVVFAMLARACDVVIFGTLYVYTIEYYPAVVRATGLGSASALGRVGGMATSFIVTAGVDVSLTLPLSIYMVTGLVLAISSCYLRFETVGRTAVSTIEEHEYQQAQYAKQNDLGCWLRIWRVLSQPLNDFD